MRKSIVYILIQTKFGKTEKVATKLLKFKQIEDIHELFGQWDIICKVIGKDMNEITEFLEKNLWSNEDIAGTETLVVSDIPS